MSDYPLLRASLAPQHADLPPELLNELLRGIYGPRATAEDVEGFFNDFARGLSKAAGGISQFAQQAAPMVMRALPNVASGAAGGAAFGPWGALVGAGAGLASGLLSQSSNRTARSVGGAIHGVGSLVSSVRGGGAGGALGSLTSVASGALGGTPTGRAALGGMQAARSGNIGIGGPANALAGLLGRPELVRSLLASLLGAAGRPSVPVGSQQVPVSQMLSALSNIAGRAAHEAAEAEGAGEATPEYAEHAAEAFGIDPEDAEGRTDALLTLLALTPSIWMNQPAPVSVQITPNDPWFPARESAWVEMDESWLDEDWSSEAWDESGESNESDVEAWDEHYV